MNFQVLTSDDPHKVEMFEEEREKEHLATCFAIL
jgi:hypothetical protein